MLSERQCGFSGEAGTMGIGEGSFYNTLKSKKHAYLESLKLYNATVGRQRGEIFFAAPTAKLGMRAFFQSVLDCLDDPKAPSRLCLMAASITREVLGESDLRKYVQQQLSMLAEGMIARLTADKESGLLPPDFDPQIVVPIIITYLQGLFRMALVSYNRPNLEQQIELFLTGLRL
jgi:TetR/AcrR family transcriptional regulator, transcriptional repressor for nem operon